MSDVEHLKAWLAFAGALAGGLLSNPLLEWTKDKLTAWRVWQTKRKEAVEGVRFVYAHLDAFWDLKSACFGQTLEIGETIIEIPPRSEVFLDALQRFDFEPLATSLRPIVELKSGDSETKSAAQFLVHQVIILLALARSIQSTAKVVPASLLREADRRYDDLKVFVGTTYAEALLGRGKLGFSYDEKVQEFKAILNKMRYEQASARRQAAAKRLAELSAKGLPPEP